MKKTILSLALALVMGGASAQSVNTTYGVLTANNVIEPMAQLPLHAESLEGTTAFFYGSGEYSNLSGVGVQSVATYNAAMKVSGEGVLQGSKIVGFSLPYQNKTNLKDLSIWVASASDINNKIYSQDIEKTQITNNSYNDLAFDEAVELPSEGVYVGYTFSVTKATSNADKFPVMFDNSCTEPNTLMLGWDSYAMEDYSDQFGSLGLKIYLKDLNIDSEYAYFGDIAYPITTPGKTYTFSIPVYSDASNAVTDIEYTIDVAGVKETRTAQVSIPAGLGRSAKINIDVVGPADLGTYEVALEITKVNGNENSCHEVRLINFSNVDRLLTRRTVVEEFTGTGCGWCPRGLAGMDLMKETYPDKFVGIGLHQYNSNDPMYIAKYAKLGFTGAPSCMIDRKSGAIDPYYGTNESILDDFDAYNVLPAELEVAGLKAVWTDETKTAVDVEATIDFLADGNFSVAYVLTGDNVYSTKSAFKQQNYYSQYTAAQVGNDPLIAQFCSGGQYGQSSFAWHFNDVALSASYTSAGANTADALEAAVAGTSQENACTLDMPTKSALLDALDYDQIYAVAIVTKNSTGEVANAFRTRVLTADDADGIQSVYGADAAVVGYYTLDGKALAAPQHGINIVKMSNGTVKKVMK